ncbi:tRNA ligase class II core domain protein [Cooperia oncophora]
MRLIDIEMESTGAMKITMPILGPRRLWEKASRWDSMGTELLRMKDRHEVEWCLQPTAEEMCTELVAQLMSLKKRMFPLLLYQTTEKFRDEMNPVIVNKFGLLRARQFLMKDLYSFDIDKEASDQTYQMVPAAPGVHGGSQSHEYHLKNPLDEDGIHFCSSCGSGSKREDGPHECKCGDPTA